jgi:glutaredoxin-like protein NrdH
MVAVTVYSTGPSCMQCAMTKRALDARGITFVEVNPRQNAAATDYVQDELGTRRRG